MTRTFSTWFLLAAVAAACAPPPPPAGKCSDHQHRFGCFDIVMRGASKEPPVPLPAPKPTICID